MARKTRTKRRVRKNIPSGVAHIHSTFNLTGTLLLGAVREL